jgi:two-component system sensor histidine kinase DesK
LNAELAAMDVPEGSGAHARLQDVVRQSREALVDLRQVVTKFRQPTLAGELSAARGALRSVGIDFGCTGSADGIPVRAASVLVWATREGVTNVIRHSQARHCWITLSCDCQAARLTVVDDGKGSRQEEPAEALVGVRERVAAVGGRLEAGNLGHSGFPLAAEVPVP